MGKFNLPTSNKTNFQLLWSLWSALVFVLIFALLPCNGMSTTADVSDEPALQLKVKPSKSSVTKSEHQAKTKLEAYNLILKNHRQQDTKIKTNSDSVSNPQTKQTNNQVKDKQERIPIHDKDSMSNEIDDSLESREKSNHAKHKDSHVEKEKTAERLPSAKKTDSGSSSSPSPKSIGNNNNLKKVVKSLPKSSSPASPASPVSKSQGLLIESSDSISQRRQNNKIQQRRLKRIRENNKHKYESIKVFPARKSTKEQTNAAVPPMSQELGNRQNEDERHHDQHKSIQRTSNSSPAKTIKEEETSKELTEKGALKLRMKRNPEESSELQNNEAVEKSEVYESGEHPVAIDVNSKLGMNVPSREIKKELYKLEKQERKLFEHNLFMEKVLNRRKLVRG